jgi:hypothetical protein
VPCQAFQLQFFTTWENVEFTNLNGIILVSGFEQKLSVFHFFLIDSKPASVHERTFRMAMCDSTTTNLDSLHKGGGPKIKQKRKEEERKSFVGRLPIGAIIRPIGHAPHHRIIIGAVGDGQGGGCVVLPSLSKQYCLRRSAAKHVRVSTQQPQNPSLNRPDVARAARRERRVCVVVVVPTRVAGGATARTVS